ncbi:MAG: hypothetical protein HYU64_14940 [Armatimonadetes bacterium]|nr:hypothetical protein [Armatimonadota bacterium]
MGVGLRWRRGQAAAQKAHSAFLFLEGSRMAVGFRSGEQGFRIGETFRWSPGPGVSALVQVGRLGLATTCPKRLTGRRRRGQLGPRRMAGAKRWVATWPSLQALSQRGQLRRAAASRLVRHSARAVAQHPGQREGEARSGRGASPARKLALLTLCQK